MVKLQADPSEGTSTKDAQKKKGFSSLLRTTKSAASGSRRLIPFKNRRVKQPDKNQQVEPPIRQISFTAGGAPAGSGDEREEDHTGDASRISSLTDRDGLNKAAAAHADHNTQSSISSKSSAFSYSHVGNEKKRLTADMKLFSKQTTMPQLELSGKVRGEDGGAHVEARTPTTSPVVAAYGSRREPEETRTQSNADGESFVEKTVLGSEPPEETEISNLAASDEPASGMETKNFEKSPSQKKKKSKTVDAKENVQREPPPEESSIPRSPSKKPPVSESDKKLAFERVRALLNRVNPRSRHEDLTTPRVDNTGNAHRRPIDPSPVNEENIEEHETELTKAVSLRDPSPSGGHTYEKAAFEAGHEDVELEQDQSGLVPSFPTVSRIPNGGLLTRTVADPPTSPMAERRAVDAPEESVAENQLFPDILGGEEQGTSAKREDMFSFPDILGDFPGVSSKEKENKGGAGLVDGDAEFAFEASSPSSQRIESVQMNEAIPIEENAKSPNENADPIESKRSESKFSRKTTEKTSPLETGAKFVFDEESSQAESPLAKKSKSRRSSENSMRLRVLKTSVVPKSKNRSSLETVETVERVQVGDVESSDDEIPAPAIDTAAMLAALESTLPPRNPSRASTSPRRTGKSRKKKSSGPLIEPNAVQETFNRRASAIAEKHAEKRRLSAGKAKAEKKLAGSKALAKAKLEENKKQEANNRKETSLMPEAAADNAFPVAIDFSTGEPISDLDHSVKNKFSESAALWTVPKIDQRRDDVESISIMESQEEDDQDRYAPLFTVLTPDSPVTDKTQTEFVHDAPNGHHQDVEQGPEAPRDVYQKPKTAILADEITEWTGESVGEVEGVEMVIHQPSMLQRANAPVIASPCSANDVLECLALDEPRDVVSSHRKTNHPVEESCEDTEANENKEENIAMKLSNCSQPIVKICEANGVLEILALDDNTVDVSEEGIVNFDFSKAWVSNDVGASSKTMKQIEVHEEDCSEIVSTNLAESPTSFGVEATESQHLSYQMRTQHDYEQTIHDNSSEDAFEIINLSGKESKTDENPMNDSDLFELADPTHSALHSPSAGNIMIASQSISKSGSADQSNSLSGIFLASSAETGPVERLPSDTEGGRSSHVHLPTAQSSSVEERSFVIVSSGEESDQVGDDVPLDREARAPKERIDRKNDRVRQIRNEPSGVVMDSSDEQTIPAVPFDPTGMLPIQSGDQTNSGDQDSSTESDQQRSTDYSNQESRDMSMVPQKSPEFVELDCSLELSDESRVEGNAKQRVRTKAISSKKAVVKTSNVALGNGKAELIDLTSYLSIDEVDEAVWLFDVPGTERSSSGIEQESDTESIVDLTGLKLGCTTETIANGLSSTLDSVIRYGTLFLDDLNLERKQSMASPGGLPQSPGLLVPTLSNNASPKPDVKVKSITKTDTINASDDEEPKILFVVKGKDVDKVVQSQNCIRPIVKPVVSTVPVEVIPGRVWGYDDLFPINESEHQQNIGEQGKTYYVSEEIISSSSQVMMSHSASESTNDRLVDKVNDRSKRTAAIYPEQLQNWKMISRLKSGSARYPLHAVVADDDKSKTSALTEDHIATQGSRAQMGPKEYNNQGMSVDGSESASLNNLIHPSNATRMKPSPEFLFASNARSGNPPVSKSHHELSRMTPESSLATRNPRDAYSAGETELDPKLEVQSHGKSSIGLSESMHDDSSLVHPRESENPYLHTENSSLSENSEIVSDQSTNRQTNDIANQTHQKSVSRRILPKPETQHRSKALKQAAPQNVAKLTSSKNGPLDAAVTTFKPKPHSCTGITSKNMQLVETSGSMVARNSDASSSESYEVVEWMVSQDASDPVSRHPESCDVDEATHTSVLVDPMAVPMEACNDMDQEGQESASQASPIAKPKQNVGDDRVTAMRKVVDAMDVTGVELDGDISPVVVVGSLVNLDDEKETSFYKTKPVLKADVKPDNFDKQSVNSRRTGRTAKSGDQRATNAFTAAEISRLPQNEIPSNIEGNELSNQNATPERAELKPLNDSRKHTKASPARMEKQIEQASRNTDFLDYFFEGTETILCGESVFVQSKPASSAHDEIENGTAEDTETVIEHKSLMTSDDTDCAVVSSHETPRKDIIDTVFEGAESLFCLDDDHPNNCFRSSRTAREEEHASQEQIPFADSLGPIPESVQEEPEDRESNHRAAESHSNLGVGSSELRSTEESKTMPSRTFSSLSVSGQSTRSDGNSTPDNGIISIQPLAAVADSSLSTEKRGKRLSKENISEARVATIAVEGKDVVLPKNTELNIQRVATGEVLVHSLRSPNSPQSTVHPASVDGPEDKVSKNMREHDSFAHSIERDLSKSSQHASDIEKEPRNTQESVDLSMENSKNNTKGSRGIVLSQSSSSTNLWPLNSNGEFEKADSISARGSAQAVLEENSSNKVEEKGLTSMDGSEEDSNQAAFSQSSLNVLVDAPARGDQIMHSRLCPSNSSSDPNRKETESQSERVAQTKSAIRKKSDGDEDPIQIVLPFDSTGQSALERGNFTPADSTLVFEFSRSEELMDLEDSCHLEESTTKSPEEEHGVLIESSRSNELDGVVPTGDDIDGRGIQGGFSTFENTLPSSEQLEQENRGPDPPTISDSSTEQTSSFESSNKFTTFESATYDDTIPSRPVILPDFPSKSDSNLDVKREGVEVRVFSNAHRGVVSESLSLATDLEGLSVKEDPVARSSSSLRRSMDPPSPSYGRISPRRTGIDPPTSQWAGDELDPLPEDPPSGDGGIGIMWSEADEKSTGSCSSPVEVDKNVSSFHASQSGADLQRDAGVFVTSVECPVVAATDVTDATTNDTTTMGTVVAAVVTATDATPTNPEILGDPGNRLKCQGAADATKNIFVAPEGEDVDINNLLPLASSLENSVDKTPNHSTLSQGSRLSTKKSEQSQNETDHSACTERVLNISACTENRAFHSIDEYEAEETEDGVEVSILQRRKRANEDENSRKANDVDHYLVGAVSSDAETRRKETHGDSVGERSSTTDENRATDNVTVDSTSAAGSSVDKVVAARESMGDSTKCVQRTLSVQSSGILEEPLAKHDIVPEKDSSGGLIFPLVAQLTDTSWCVGSQIFSSSPQARNQGEGKASFVEETAHYRVSINAATDHVDNIQRTTTSPSNSSSDKQSISSTSHCGEDTDSVSDHRRPVSSTVHRTGSKGRSIVYQLQDGQQNGNCSESEASSSESSVGDSDADNENKVDEAQSEAKRALEKIQSNDSGIIESDGSNEVGTSIETKSITRKTDNGNGMTGPSGNRNRLFPDEIPYTTSEREHEVAIDSSSSSMSANNKAANQLMSHDGSVSSEPDMGSQKIKSSLSRVERVRAMVESPDYPNNFSSSTPRATDFSVSSEPDSIMASSKNKRRGISKFSRSPRLQNVLDRLRKRLPTRKGATMEASADSSETEPVDVNDLFSRYDNIVKNMVVNDKERLDRKQQREAATVGSQTVTPANHSPLIDVTHLGSDTEDKSFKSDTKSTKSRDDVSISELRASPNRKNQIATQRACRSVTTLPQPRMRQPLMKSNSFSSTSEFSVTPSQKARDLRKQLDQALQTSAAIRNSQEKLNTEISTFKSRLQLQSHVSPKNLSPMSRRLLSPRRSNSASDLLSSSTDAYVSLADIQRQRMESHRAGNAQTTEESEESLPSQTLDSYFAERERGIIEARNTDEALHSFRGETVVESQDGRSAYEQANKECLYLSPSAPTDSDEDEIRSQQVDSILNGLAQASSAQTSSPKRCN